MLENRTIHAARALLVWGIRAGALVLIALGLFLIGARLMYGVLGVGDLPSAWNAWQGIGEDHGFFRGVPMTLVGVTLALLSKRLARWVIVAPESGCPRCAYPTAPDPAATDRPDHCSECGYQPPTPTTPPVSPASPPPSPTPGATP